MSMDRREVEELIRNAYDLHMHIGTDILPRRYTVEELVDLEEGKIAGIALKSHCFPTISTINDVLRQRQTPLRLFGSITLNYFMGGFNASAIYASAVMSPEHPLIVWFPTVHAWNHLKHNYSDYEIPPEWVKDPLFKPRLKTELKAIRVSDDINNQLYDKCVRVLHMVKKMRCVVGTGHLSWQEVEPLARTALDMGIKVILTHPMQRDISMPLRLQKELAQLGAFVEFCYIMYLDRDNEADYPLDEMTDKISEIGADQCILTSDTGQLGNPPPSECLARFVELLSQQGITRTQFEKMLIRNPRRIMDMGPPE